MTLEQLRIFIAVAEREHVTLAARDLNLTQSATSAAIAALEARHAIRLFDRIGRRVVLTDPGRMFLAEAKAVLSRAASAEMLLQDIAGLKRGVLRLAASQTVANYWLPPLLARYRVDHPGIELRLTIGNTAEVAALAHAGDIDLGIIEGEIDDPALAIRPVASDRLSAIIAADAPSLPAGPVGRETARGLAWVMREWGSGTRDMAERAFARLGLSVGDLDIRLELPSNEAVLAAVRAGAGAAILSERVVAASIAAGWLVRLEMELPARAFLSLRHKERLPTRALTRFLELVEASPDA